MLYKSTFTWEAKWTQPVWDYKPAWKQVMFTWSFVSAAFQSDPIYWWTCVGISFRMVFTWYFNTRNEISFLSKWPTWNPYRHFGVYHPYRSFNSPQFMWTQVKRWLNTKVRFSTEMKSHTGLSLFHLSCEHTLIKQYIIPNVCGYVSNVFVMSK